ncbi:hypothetical protein RXV86_01520 [Alisedimentitalea sp. MJ-SS2]|uniref:hypothetical protein n=1 Tax=Aliisedimentitalea sp. MJ-SS2 TaxID=3049795 RepID=UPI00290DB51F|nr:hypothetical protein [Alisedimentitalea sp. MJ-SS2]MDU8926055.1 hypothetical protein [Alisedimentitalea sp. MJ-SS2]
MGAALAAACLTLPGTVLGQEGGLRDQPRSFEIFAHATDYEGFSSERHGTLANPQPNELGFLLVLRMFRTVCLGLERGAALDAVVPPGFSAHHSAPYYFGPDAARRGDKLVLSATGDVEKDEDGGHPAIWLEPRTGGMECALDWRIAADMSPDSQRAIATLLARWVPWEMALLPASRPQLLEQPALSDAIEWDRPCMGRWCPTSAFFSLSRGDISLRTILNITAIEGTRP